MSDEGYWKDLEDRVAAIAAEGRAVRDRVAEVVAGAIASGKSAARGVGDVIGRSARGAAEGARQATAESRRGVLRDVVDGVGDGVARSGLAAKLAFDEARRRGQAFARQDLERLVKDLGGAGRQIVEAFATAVADAGGEVAGQAAVVREHAERTREQIEPGLKAAADAVRKDPFGLAVDAAQAGAAAARRAAGELFDALGGMLGQAADRLKKR